MSSNLTTRASGRTNYGAGITEARIQYVKVRVKGSKPKSRTLGARLARDTRGKKHFISPKYFKDINEEFGKGLIDEVCLVIGKYRGRFAVYKGEGEPEWDLLQGQPELEFNNRPGDFPIPERR